DRLYGTATRRSFGLNLAMEIRIVESRTRKGVGAEGLVAKHARAATEMHSESGAVAHPIRQACTVQEIAHVFRGEFQPFIEAEIPERPRPDDGGRQAHRPGR